MGTFDLQHGNKRGRRTIKDIIESTCNFTALPTKGRTQHPHREGGGRGTTFVGREKKERWKRMKFLGTLTNYISVTSALRLTGGKGGEGIGIDLPQ